jgi:RNA-binding protein
LDAKELIKIKVLETAAYTPTEAGYKLAEATDSELVQVIGAKIILYRKSRKKEKRELSVLIDRVR